MTRIRRARALALLTSLGYLGTAALHGTGYGSIVRLSADGPDLVGRLMPALWLAFSSDLVVLGVIIGVVALQPTSVARIVLPIAAVCPLVVAGLQVHFIGFVPPTAILIGIGVLALAAAAAWPPARRTDTGLAGDERPHEKSP